MGRIYSNNYLASLSSAIITSDTTMTVSTAVGLPSISGSQYFYLTIDGGFVKEIVKVTAVASTTLTIVRAQDGTSAANWAAGVVVELRFTKSSVIDWTDTTSNIVTTGSITANTHIDGYTTTATAAGTTTLTSTSTRLQFFSGSTTQNCKLPVTNTLVLGQQYFIMNNSSGVVTVQSSGANTVQAIGAGSSALVTCISLSGTGAASWSVLYTQVGGTGVTGPGSSTNNGLATYSGTGGATLLDSGAGNTLVSGVLTLTADAVIHSVTLGRGLQGTATNTALGNGALSADTSSSANNTCVGYQAGIGVGNATQCTALGALAVVGTTSSAVNNTCIGYNAGHNLAASASCTIIGANAGNTNHSSMTLVGTSCGGGAGANDTMMGALSGVTGSGDSFGSQAMRYPTGGLNCAFGNGALIGASAGSTAGSSSAFGYNALGGTGLTSASQNCGFGYQAGVSITTGGNNTLVGYAAGNAGASGSAAITTGTDNTCIGMQAGVDTLSAVGCIAIGENAVALKSTGATSGTNGPGIAIGSASKLVGFRGDGTIYPSTSGGSGFWRMRINGTSYFVPLYADASTTLLPLTNTATGSGQFVGDTSPTITTPNIVGTTAVGNASAGSVGQVISSTVLVGSAVSVSNATATNITSISLTAGDWDLEGNVVHINSGANMSNASVWISATSATQPDVALLNIFVGSAIQQYISLSAPMVRVNVSSTTTYYLSGQAGFIAGTNTACGSILARRVR